eukprot:scaffold83045_cov25-Cyclotella_meneghiniana.AAC.1
MNPLNISANTMGIFSASALSQYQSQAQFQRHFQGQFFHDAGLPMPDSTTSDEDSDASDAPSLLGRDDESGVSSDGSYQRASRQLQHELFGRDGVDVHDVPSFIDVPAEEEGEIDTEAPRTRAPRQHPYNL